MSATVYKITGVSIVYSSVCSGADHRKHQSSASLAFGNEIHRWPVDSPHKGPGNAEYVSIWWRHHVLSLVNLPLLCVWLSFIGSDNPVYVKSNSVSPTGTHFLNQCRPGWVTCHGVTHHHDGIESKRSVSRGFYGYLFTMLQREIYMDCVLTLVNSLSPRMLCL